MSRGVDSRPSGMVARSGRGFPACPAAHELLEHPGRAHDRGDGVHADAVGASSTARLRVIVFTALSTNYTMSAPVAAARPRSRRH